MTRSAVLDGYFGMHNAGDDAFCVVTSKMLHERLGFDRLALVASHDALPILPQFARGLLPAEPRFRGHVRAATIAGKVRYRTVVHAGGSTLRRMNQRRRDEARLQRAGLISSHAVGVSVGPFRNSGDEREMREFLKRFRSISVRDVASHERATSLALDVPLMQAFDLAVLAPETPTPIRNRRPRPRLGVALRLFESTEGGGIEIEHRRTLRTVELLKVAAELVDYELVLLAFNCHPTKGDVGLANVIADELKAVVPSSVEAYGRNVGSMLAAVAQCDAVLAMRLHAGVFAYSLGVPFAMIDYHPKCSEFAQFVGLPEHLVFAGDGSDFTSHAATVAALLTGEAASLMPLQTARTMARSAFDLLESHLED